jgi:hypothetical protein
LGTNDNIYDKLHEFLGTEEQSINIMEESIASETQLEYFECSRSFISKRSEEEIIRDKDQLLDLNMPLEKKKLALLELASLNNIEAYRAIERYLNHPDIKLYDWACMALQESRLQLESQLLDENKVLITTGLGGKGFKLRYFIVLFTPNGKALSKNQKSIIKKELEFCLRTNNSELEDIEFEDAFASVLCMIPLNVPPQPVFQAVIKECNVFGNFLFDDFIITNMKALSGEEIREVLTENNIY